LKWNNVEYGYLLTIYGNGVEQNLQWLYDIRISDLADTTKELNERFLSILFKKRVLINQSYIYESIGLDASSIKDHHRILKIASKILDNKQYSREDIVKLASTIKKMKLRGDIDVILECSASSDLKFEIKLFTVPPDDEPERLILRHLSKTELNKYFCKRKLDYIVLMTFSFLYSHEKYGMPVPLSADEFEPYGGIPSIWCAHLVFLHPNVQNLIGGSAQKKGNIKWIGKQILSQIEEDGRNIVSKLKQIKGLNKKIFNICIIYNYIKVLLMWQQIEKYENIIQEKDKKLQEKDKKLQEIIQKKDKKLQEKDKEIEELKKQLEMLKNKEKT